MSALLEVRNLRTMFKVEGREIPAVDGVSFEVAPGRTLGIVGESGCGKSVTALSIMGLVPQPPGRIADGEIVFEGTDLLTLPAAAMRELRGNRIGMIFQEPMTSLNPAFTVGDQIVEVILRHRPGGRSAAKARAIEMLRKVRIPSPETRYDEYPHRLSGGMRQRVMIAMALACDPKLLIADEPTTALDVTIQAQILDLLVKLRRDNGMGLVLITHDMGVVAETAERVVVQYAGQQVETNRTGELFNHPHHPYTAALLAALPERATERRLPAIPGVVPGQFDRPKGCQFSPRCAHASDLCQRQQPNPAPKALGRALCHTPLVDGIPITRQGAGVAA